MSLNDAVATLLEASEVVNLPGEAGSSFSKIKILKADGKKLFVKIVNDNEKVQMLTGEHESLLAMKSTMTIRVPLTYGKINYGRNIALVMEYLDMVRLSTESAQLGTNFAQLHKHNIERLKKQDANQQNVGSTVMAVKEFGFHCNTYCGEIVQNNTWNADWPTFFAGKIDFQVAQLMEKYGIRELRDLWSLLQKKLHRFFDTITIQPSLLHGDLWYGNSSQLNGTPVPVIYDPSSFYGHHEFDLAIAKYFGGFNQSFWSAYHKEIPKEPGFKERLPLYTLFHQLNHWNHYGDGYKSQSLNNLRTLCK